MYPKQGHTLTEATKKLEGFCTYQERCHMEVVDKLRDMGMITESIDLIVVHLIKHNYLNEERFARSFARGKFKIKKWGKIRIVNELKHRGISKYNIQTALKEIGEGDYVSTLDSLAKKRLASLKEPNLQKRRKKLVDYMLYRGWESDLVYEKALELIP